MADPAPATKKRLPFKRTVARKKTPDAAADEPSRVEAKKNPDDEDEGIQFFRRNQDAFSYFDDLETPRKEKENTSPARAAVHREETHGHKRRKVSLEGGSDDDSGFIGSGGSRKRLSSPPSARKEQLTPTNLDDDLIMDIKGKGKEVTTPRGPRVRRKSSTATPSQEVVELDDDDEYKPTPGAGYPRHESAFRTRNSLRGRDENDFSLASHGIDNPFGVREISPEIEILSDSDHNRDGAEIDPEDEFALEIAQARARAEAKAAAEHDGSRLNKAAVSILIGSPGFPDAAPQQFRRRLGQPLSLVLETWIQLQRTKGTLLPDDSQNKLFLTWRRNKIYGSASVSTLPGIEIDSEGNLKGNALPRKEDGFHEGGLYLEVWSEELLTEHERSVQREREFSLGILEEEDAVGFDETESQAQKPKGIKVILKARKDFDPVKLTVHLDTTVDTMITAFRQQRNVDEASDISIFFDGEELDPDSRVEELDIDPDDTNQLEVHIK